MNITREQFDDEFQTFGTSIDDEDLYDRLNLLCMQYKIDAAEIAMEWVAFSHTSKTKMGKLSLETIDAFDRLRLSKKQTKGSKTPVSKKNNKNKFEDHGLQNISHMEQSKDMNILDAYTTPENKLSNKRMHTPENPVNKRLIGVNNSPVVPFSPASYSPKSSKTSQKYSSRSNSNEVTSKFGTVDGAVWKSNLNKDIHIIPYTTECHLSEKFKYMFQKSSVKAMILNDVIEDMAEIITKHHGIEELVHINTPIQEEATVIGRVGCDSVGKLNSKSLILDSCKDYSSGRSIAVDLSELKQFSFFPGQIVALEGLNITGNKFVAQKLYDGVPLPLSPKKPSLHESINVVIACGPFTTSDNLFYEPLADLIKCIQKEPVDICILMGPFVDTKHIDIEKCNMTSTFEEFFTKTMEQVVNSLQKYVSHVLVLPSHRDVHHEAVYPQPPFELKKMDREKIQFLSDPCTISINGVVFGISSTDILFHLGQEEISFPPGAPDRLGRLTRHILTQNNYYPLYPALEDMNIDYDQYEIFSRLPCTPHILVLPSDLRDFIKEIHGCCCINPGRLTKGQSGGSYCRLNVNPSAANQPIIQCIAAEIVRI